jgi:PD-(D/E)XK nuclease superfamily
MFIQHCLKIYKYEILSNDAMNVVETEVFTNMDRDYERRIDILIRDNDNKSAIGIEVKIESNEIKYSEGVTQIQYYKDWLDNKYNNRNALIYLTKYNTVVKSNLCIHVLWGDVIKIISDVISLQGEDNNNLLLFEFRKYVEEEIMKFNGFSFQDKFSKGDYDLKLLMDEIYLFLKTLSDDYIKMECSNYSDGYDYYNKIEYDYYYYKDKISSIEVGISSYKHYKNNKQNI